MIRPNSVVRWTLGPIALVALVAGCSRERPARQPPPSPAFESSVRESRTPPRAEPGMPGGAQPQPEAQPTPMGPEPGAAPPGAVGAPGAQPGAMGAPGAQPGGMAPMVPEGTPPTGEPGVNERELCDTLTRDSRATVEDVQGGVALVLRPQQGGSMDTVREHARKVESAMASAASAKGGPTGAETCPLFDLARQGATTSMSDTPRGVRLVIVTQDPTQVKALRKQVRDFVKPAAQKKGQGGGPKQQGGEKGQHGGEKGQQGGTNP